jgi:hypothetical protein
MTDPASPDLKTLWQAQEQETDPMTLEQIHALVAKFDRKTRRATIVVPLAMVISTLVLGMCWMSAADTDVRVALALCFVGTTGCCMLAMRLLLLQRDPAESAADFLKRRMQTHLRKAQGGWLLYLAPVVPAMIAVLFVAFRRSHALIWAPLLPLVILAAGLGFVAVRTRLQARKLRADLDELDRLMGR